MRYYLEARGYKVKLKRKENLEFENNSFYILRIQWIGEGNKKDKPFYGWSHWSEATSHTHFIVVYKNQFFCNEEGLFNVNNLNEYLEDYGVITSAMEIRKEIR